MYSPLQFISRQNDKITETCKFLFNGGLMHDQLINFHIQIFNWFSLGFSICLQPPWLSDTSGSKYYCFGRAKFKLQSVRTI